MATRLPMASKRPKMASNQMHITEDPEISLAELQIEDTLPPDCVLSLDTSSIVLNGKILKSGLMADVTFEVGPEMVKLQAHKVFLASASEVFHAMFFGPMPEGNSVVIPDCSPEAFRLMLQHVYMGIVPTKLKVELGLELLYLAKKYMLTNYEAMIEGTLKSIVNNENVLGILSGSISYDSSELETVCWTYVDQNIRQITETEQFLTADFALLCKIMPRATLQIPELDLFFAVQRWGNAEMKRNPEIANLKDLQNVLRPCLLHIRFPTMTLTDFCNGPCKSCLLDEKEISQILHCISPKPTDIGLAEDCPYCKIPRTPFKQFHGIWSYSGTYDWPKSNLNIEGLFKDPDEDSDEDDEDIYQDLGPFPY